MRMMMGGSWDNNAAYARVALRAHFDWAHRSHDHLGFRLVRKK